MLNSTNYVLCESTQHNRRTSSRPPRTNCISLAPRLAHQCILISVSCFESLLGSKCPNPMQDEFQASKNCISLAARLAQLEHSIPYEAVDEEVPHEDWHAWE